MDTFCLGGVLLAVVTEFRENIQLRENKFRMRKFVGLLRLKENFDVERLVIVPPNTVPGWVYVLGPLATEGGPWPYTESTCPSTSWDWNKN